MPNLNKIKKTKVSRLLLDSTQALNNSLQHSAWNNKHHFQDVLKLICEVSLWPTKISLAQGFKKLIEDISARKLKNRELRWELNSMTLTYLMFTRKPTLTRSVRNMVVNSQFLFPLPILSLLMVVAKFRSRLVGLSPNRIVMKTCKKRNS
jgi:hypothetical protein